MMRYARTVALANSGQIAAAEDAKSNAMILSLGGKVDKTADS